MEEVPLPQELKGAPPRVLEAYVKARILQLLEQPGLQGELPQPAKAALQQAAERGEREGLALGRSAELMLVFKHDCQHVGCADLHCALCSQNQLRRCARPFMPKYLSGDVIRAACGAVIRVELVDRATQRLMDPPELAGAQLEMSIMDGRALEGLTGVALTDAELDRIALLLNPQGAPLLAARQAGHTPAGAVVTPLKHGVALLPDLYVAGSSEAILSGQKPPFVLLVRLVAADGRRVAVVKPLLSDGFVVATPRVRGAAKKEIPHLEDHVSKLTSVGAATQAKLKDLRKAAQDAGFRNLSLPFDSVSKVGEFRELVLWAEADARRCDYLKKMLKLTKGWEEARDHALRAVVTDNQLRLWYSTPTLDRGLLFGCEGAVPSFDQPLALLERGFSSGGAATLQAEVLVMSSGASEEVLSLAEQAKAAWGRRGHPGWAILGLDTQYFMQACAHLPTVVLPPQLVAEAVPQSMRHVEPSSGSPTAAPGAAAAAAAAPHTPPAAAPATAAPGAGAGRELAQPTPHRPAAAAAAAAAGGGPEPSEPSSSQSRASREPAPREGTPAEQVTMRLQFAGLGVGPAAPPAAPSTSALFGSPPAAPRGGAPPHAAAPLSLPPQPPLAAGPGGGGFTARRQQLPDFPSIPDPDTLAALLSSLPSFDAAFPGGLGLGAEGAGLGGSGSVAGGSGSGAKRQMQPGAVPAAEELLISPMDSMGQGPMAGGPGPSATRRGGQQAPRSGSPEPSMSSAAADPLRQLQSAGGSLDWAQLLRDAYKSTGAAGGPPGAPKPAAAAPQAAAAGATAPGAGRPPLVLAQRAQQAQQGGLQLRFRDLSLGRLGPAISGLDWEGLLLDEQAGGGAQQLTGADFPMVQRRLSEMGCSLGPTDWAALLQEFGGEPAPPPPPQPPRVPSPQQAQQAQQGAISAQPSSHFLTLPYPARQPQSGGAQQAQQAAGGGAVNRQPAAAPAEPAGPSSGPQDAPAGATDALRAAQQAKQQAQLCKAERKRLLSPTVSNITAASVRAPQPPAQA